ncbi:MAG TPA: hypothetical protein P5217_07595 [Methanoregulaceae archaeon]|nr:hypothetical protein [Methanoregulaceae archaeon]HRY76131.1 hypothetical protein [Methanoregulaceae archaeon]
MATPYLADDESVVLATENIRVRSTPYQALILTNKRVLLVRTEGEKISAEEFLIADLRSALVSQAAKDDPTLLLSYVTPRGEARRESIAFTASPDKSRKDEVREWAKKLSDQLKPLPDEETTSPSPPPRGATFSAGGSKAGSTADILAKHERLAGLTFPDIDLSDEPEKEPSRTKTVVIAVLAVIVVAALAWMFLLPHVPPQEISVTPAATQTPVPERTTVPATEVPTIITPATPELPAKLIVPSTGVWIRVEYAGNYTGTVGSGSILKEVSDTGEHLYQQAITTGSVRAIVEKTDASGGTLTVQIYKDGKVVSEGTTSRPNGEVNLQIDLAAPAATPAP